MSYKLAIFDFDGTLADSAGWMRGVINQVARRYRFRTVGDDEFEELRGKDTREILAHLGVATWKLPFIARHMRGLAARDAEHIRVFPGVHELLALLGERGVVVAVVSSNSEANVRTVLGPRSAARVQHYACGAGLFGKRKKFRRVLSRARVSPHEAIAIGDEVRDIEAAQGEQIAAGVVSWGYARPSLLRTRSPNVVFESVDDIARLFAHGT